jgi:hypothetical protein
MSDSAPADAWQMRKWHLFALACGVITPAIYVATDLLLAMRWDGYSLRDQTISELNAIGAPTRTPSIVLGLVGYSFMIVFGWGVWRTARGGRNLRIVGGAFVLLGLFAWWSVPFASMHVREAEEGLSDSLHLLGLTIAGGLLMAAMWFGAGTFGIRFRIYTIATVVCLIGFGAWSGMDGARVADNLETPWVGVKERISVYSYQLWIAVFAVAVMRRELAEPA